MLNKPKFVELRGEVFYEGKICKILKIYFPDACDRYHGIDEDQLKIELPDGSKKVIWNHQCGKKILASLLEKIRQEDCALSWNTEGF